MSRLRTIKPGFFLDEELAECEPLARLLFAGLWTIADREGRLEDRPRRIKVEVLPYDVCDVGDLLDELDRHGFITRYAVGDSRFIAIPTWHKHQSPHIKEQASTIPAPDSHGASTIHAQNLPPSSCLVSCLGSGDLVKNSLSDSHESDGADFDEWWSEYGRIGDRSRACDLYLWWRRTKHATRDDLLTAALSYRDHCSATDCKMKHAATFLAKPTKTRSAVWPEWASGEAHGTMDAGADAHLSDVLVAGAKAFGLNGGDNGHGSGSHELHSGTTTGGAPARRGLPAGKLAQGQ